ncbi:hypothetical protein, partial [Parabacteroides sp.]
MKKNVIVLPRKKKHYHEPRQSFREKKSTIANRDRASAKKKALSRTATELPRKKKHYRKPRQSFREKKSTIANRDRA